MWGRHLSDLDAKPSEKIGRKEGLAKLAHVRRKSVRVVVGLHSCSREYGMLGRRMANCFLYRTVIPDFTNSKSTRYASSTKAIIEVESCDWLYPF